MPGAQRWTAVTLIVANVAFAALCHFHAHRRYADRLNTLDTLYDAGATPSVPAPAPAMSRRTWVLIIDGLRADAIATMPRLQTLARSGVQRTLVAELPSYTYASLTTLVTGIEPFYSGVRLNGGSVHHRYDTLLAAAARAGVPSVIASDHWRSFDAALDWKNGPRAMHASIDELIRRSGQREMAWIHVDEVDAAGHRFGARSREYRNAAIQADEVVGRLAAALDSSRDEFVVVSDHGHVARGGHGGPEPAARDGIFVAAGTGVGRARALPPARLRDACATIAMLAGIAPPVDNLGAPMADILASDVDARTLLAPAERERVTAQSRLLVAPDAVAGRLAQRRAARFPWAFGACAVLVAAWLAPRRWRPRAVDGAPLAAFAVVFAALYAAAGYGLSWTLPRGYAGFVIDTALVGAAGAVACVLVGRWRRLGGRARAAQQASFVFALACAYSFAVAESGTNPAWLEGPHRSFALVLIATAGFYAALGLAIIALAGARYDGH